MARWILPTLLLLTAALACADEPAAKKYALLVGVTHYTEPLIRSLQDGGNNVALLRDVLVGRFQFPEKNVVTLSENAGTPELLPTRAAIQREFAALAAKARSGDQVVILLSGHGSQQADRDNDPNIDPEPDGLDETFLPRDAGPSDPTADVLANAIIDDELRAWAGAITARGASVFVVVDACHSGSLLRDTVEVAKNVPAERLVNRDKLLAAAKKAAPGNTDLAFRVTDPGQKEQHLAVIYACLSTQSTPDRPYEVAPGKQVNYGLLTHTLCGVLTQAKSAMTYRELTLRIRECYTGQGRGDPTPVVEGPDQDREALGSAEWPERSALHLIRDGQGGWAKINAGSLQGLTPGSILAVFPRAGEGQAVKALTHVVVEKVELLESAVKPCDFQGLAATAELPPEGRCQVAWRELGLRLPLGLDPSLKASPAATMLRQLAEKKDSLFKLVEPDQASWVLRRVNDKEADGPLFLAPAQGRPVQGDAVAPPRFGPYPLADLEAKLADSLGRIARAQNLLALAATSEETLARGPKGLKVDVSLLRFRDAQDADGQEVKPESRSRLIRAGDRIAVEVANTSPESVDVTILRIDGDYAIHDVFPRVNAVAENQLKRNYSYKTGSWNPKSSGVEHVVVIAVRARKVPVNFSTLAQPGLDRLKGTSGTAFGSPLGRLLRHALYADGSPKGDDPADIEDYCLRVVSYPVK